MMKRLMRSSRSLRVASGVCALALVLSLPQLYAQMGDEPDRLFKTLELASGMTVGEIGAGAGEMTIEIAKRVGPTGRVYSTELDKARLAEIRERVEREKVTNVTVVEATDRSTNLPDACCDAIFMRDVYHHFTRPEDITQSLFRALKPGGRLAVIDFQPRPNTATPDGVPQNRGGHGIPPNIIAEEGKAAGLSLVSTLAEWPEAERRNRQLFLVLFRKPQS
jgi:SAM-dependent methyltransferase